MSKFFAAIILAVLIGTGPVAAQSPFAAQPVIGLPIYTADGDEVGIVRGVTRLADDIGLLCELSYRQGIGTRLVMLPARFMSLRSDRVVLSATDTRALD